MGETQASSVLRIVLDRVQHLLDERPDATGHDVLRVIQNLHGATVEMTVPTTTCRRCRQGIWTDGSGKWRHSDSANSVGCRAASFTAGDGWREDLDKTWKAQPTR